MYPVLDRVWGPWAAPWSLHRHFECGKDIGDFSSSDGARRVCVFPCELPHPTVCVLRDAFYEDADRRDDSKIGACDREWKGDPPEALRSSIQVPSCAPTCMRVRGCIAFIASWTDNAYPWNREWGDQSSGVLFHHAFLWHLRVDVR